MMKLTKLAVLSAVSTAIISVPLTEVLANSTVIYNEYTKETVRTIPSVRHPSHSSGPYNVESILRQHHPFGGYDVKSILSQHHPFHSNNQPSHQHVDHTRRVQNNQRVEYEKYRRVERTTRNHAYQSQTPNNAGDAVAAGVLGLAAGAILGHILKQPAQPQVIYQNSPKSQVVYQTQQVAEHHQIQQPWTAGWFEYCKKRYRSFNYKTGTFRGYDGLDHFCYAPLKQ
ncbi:BA14K family protein [Bartonella sp. B10]